MQETKPRERDGRALLNRLWRQAHRRADCEGLRQAFVENLRFRLGVKPDHAGPRDFYAALAYTVRDLLIERLQEADRGFARNDEKIVCYLSMEYLIGRLLLNNLINLDLLNDAEEALRGLGLSLPELAEVEPEAGLGNGGLGRLAACFLDSLATHGYPAVGYGLRYEHGMFRQEIVDGRQVERLDNWLRYPNPWEIPRPHATVAVSFYGEVAEARDEAGAFRPRWTGAKTVVGVPFDTAVVGYGGRGLSFLRLWTAKSPSELDLDLFQRGDYLGAAEDKALSESITKILYPNDASSQGRELRLCQEYFFVACSVHDLLRRFLERHADFDRLPDQVAIQLNDTHPALAVPELLRVLVDEHHLPWEKAWDLVRRTCGYTNHTLLPEALEKWPVALFARVLPRHFELVREIDRRLGLEVRAQVPGDDGVLERTSLFERGETEHVRMAHLAVAGSHHVNGVSRLHSALLRARLFPDFEKLRPGLFGNQTNGVTQRLWILKANPRLAALLDREVGPDWRTDLDLVARLAERADDPAFGAELAAIKRANKADAARFVREKTGVAIDPSMLFAVQVKRLHEYKRQLMNGLGVLVRRNRLKRDPAWRDRAVPRAVLFAGKAAPGYAAAKLILRCLCRVADVVNGDPEMKGRLAAAFLPNYSVGMAEKLIPPADLSEQISTAGCEASGTGNMKFAMNGALTVGTLDGANIEIRDAVGHEHFFLFGKTAEEIAELEAWETGPDGARRRRYDPAAVLHAHPEIAEAVGMLADGTLSPEEPGAFRPLYDALTVHGDRYFVLADLPAYLDAQDRVDAHYRDAAKWNVSAARNIAGMGWFSSDRAVSGYAREIWNLKPSF